MLPPPSRKGVKNCATGRGFWGGEGEEEEIRQDLPFDKLTAGKINRISSVARPIQEALFRLRTDRMIRTDTTIRTTPTNADTYTRILRCSEIIRPVITSNS